MVNNEVADLKQFFAKMYELGYPVHFALPIGHCDWSGDASIDYENTSTLVKNNGVSSKHAFGRAIDGRALRKIHDQSIHR